MSTYIEKLVCVRPSGILLAREELRVMGIIQCLGYPSVSGVHLTYIKKWLSVRMGLMPKFHIGEASEMFTLMNKVCQNSGPKPI